MSKHNRTKHKTDQLQPLRDELARLQTVIAARDEHEKKSRDGDSRRRYLKLAGKTAGQRGAEEDDDPFRAMYRSEPLVEPPLPFAWLWKTYTECDVLTMCIRILMNNLANPYDFEFQGSEAKEKTLPENEKDRVALEGLFARVNENDSWMRLALKVWREWFVTKNVFVNVIRGRKLGNPDGKWRVTEHPLERMYYIPSTYMRATLPEDPEQEITVTFPRDGKLQQIPIYRRFRRFARIDPKTQLLTWFKELGDPRTLDSKTGKFLAAGETTPHEATEIWWFRDNYGGQPYGIPDWIGAIWDIAGRYTAKWVNFDHLDRGALPKGFLAVSGGKLTPDAQEQYDVWVESLQQPGGYNEFPVLQTEPDTEFDLNATGSTNKGKIEFVKVRDPQHEDFMFGKYLDHTKKTIVGVWGLPPVLTGDAGNDTYASSYTSMEMAESQIFQPLREILDEEVTTRFIQNELHIFTWRMKTRQSRIGDKETFYRAVGALSRAGGLSINDIRELANQLLGTQLQPYEGDLYNEPLTIVMALAQNGMVGYEGKALIFIKAVAGAAQQANDQTNKGDYNPTNQDIESVVTRMVVGLRGLAALKYEAPTTEEINFELLESAEKFEPHDGEGKPEFLDRCIPGIIDEGKTPAQATAMCNSMWEQAKA